MAPTVTLFGLTVLACLDLPAFQHARDLDVVELFAGVGSIAIAAGKCGHQAVAYNKHCVPGQTDQASSNLTCAKTLY